MQTTHSAQPWVWPFTAFTELDYSTTRTLDPRVEAPAREHDARREITRLRDEIEDLVRRPGDDARDTLDSALESVTRLQIVTANIDACRPPSDSFIGSALVALADSRLRGHSDAIERGMTYTSDNQLRLLRGEK